MDDKGNRVSSDEVSGSFRVSQILFVVWIGLVYVFFFAQFLVAQGMAERLLAIVGL